ncbi:Gfo/Idh/MocA family protein [Paenisporosarcina sp. TG-14]|uniref:Gfo/Idh/MocA family protein n=1 Tax=Paenisporosarcina sp. TG-14 TaxID=1231057 RepID=UPI00030578F0|nr:Gfo/Idh/MocA family oxidoreductase [Paenisporosarcina sp. TG-14]
MGKLKFGIVGVGNRAKSLIRAAEETGEIEFVAFADNDAMSRKAASKLLPNAKSYARFEDLIQHHKIDAVIVATPNHQHTDIVLAAFDADIHVLCEKPMAPTVDEWNLMIESANKANKILHIGMELRYSPLVNDIHSIVNQGIIGNVKMIWCHEFRPPFRPGVGEWRHNQKMSGGSLLEKNCHHFDLFNLVSGSIPVKVKAVGSNDTIYKDYNVLDRSWVNVEYENGIHANLGLCLFYHKHKLEFGVIGDQGSIEYCSIEEKIVVETTKKKSINYYNLQSEGYAAGGYDHPGEVEQQLAFVHSIRTGEASKTSGEEAIWSQLISLAAEEAVRSDSTVKINSNRTFELIK